MKGSKFFQVPVEAHRGARPIEDLEIFPSPYRGLGRNSRNFSKYELRGGEGARRFKNKDRWENCHKSEVSAKT